MEGSDDLVSASVSVIPASANGKARSPPNDTRDKKSIRVLINGTGWAMAMPIATGPKQAKAKAECSSARGMSSSRKRSGRTKM